MPAQHALRQPTLGLYGLSLLLFMAASSAPTPLYRLYQSLWSFPVMELTLIFAAYVMSLLVSLLCFGGWSDHIGRRRIVSVALLLEALSMALFLLADGPGWLIAARLLQGVATGLAMAAMAAALMDINPQRGATLNSLLPLAGMGLGALGTGLLAKYAPQPTQLIFIILLSGFVLQALRTWRAADTVEAEPGAVLSVVPRIAVPRRLWLPLLSVVLPNMAAWALGGFYLSLMPSLLRQLAPGNYQLLGGITTALLTGCGALSIILASRGQWHGPKILLTAASGLILGSAVLLVGMEQDNVLILLSGSAVSGFGFGLGFLGVLRTMVPRVQAHERAGFMAALYILSYCSNAVPAVIAGYSAQHAGLHQTAQVFISGVLISCLLGLVLLRLNRRQLSCPAGS